MQYMVMRPFDTNASTAARVMRVTRSVRCSKGNGRQERFNLAPTSNALPRNW